MGWKMYMADMIAGLLKGFAAKASESALETVKALGEKYVPFIEEDSIVSIDGSVIENGKGGRH
jgi:hypothetical protein